MQCRKQSGHFMADAEVPEGEIGIKGAVRWYQASATARRGFCPVCGSGLFWQRLGSGDMRFSLGALDGPSGLRLQRHLHVASKGDYYEIAHGLPQE
ncbi:GFA family protein [Vannielia litorea]|uniref:GFA family protein n=1 Tax=Vannielia litorea TaxID=1217970 RepID=UPI001C988902|nr:GFA family protein [Vannielia litorea]MBY6049185.1 GFA family protein [Vannielia litorea]MBY6076599.1 GFA family protein [Vannielia litorea]